MNVVQMPATPRESAPAGPLDPGDLLVSNFNAPSNLQGTGTTIVRIRPKGKSSLFFSIPSPVGALNRLAQKSGPAEPSLVDIADRFETHDAIPQLREAHLYATVEKL